MPTMTTNKTVELVSIKILTSITFLYFFYINRFPFFIKVPYRHDVFTTNFISGIVMYFSFQKNHRRVPPQDVDLNQHMAVL